jgi:predicted PurR-regulated permease PerM
VTSNSAPAGNRSAEAEAASEVEAEADSKAVSQDDSDDAAAITPDVSESDENFGRPGPPLSRLSPFRIGFFGGLGLFVAWWLGEQVVSISSVLIQIVVALFLAAGLNPVVEFFERRGLRRGYAVLTVIVGVLAALTLFVVAFVPVITDQVATISANAPEWLDSLQRNRQIQGLDDQFQLIDKVKDYVAKGDFAGSVFGGVLGVGLAVLGALANTFVVTVLTLYFLSSLEKTKRAIYKLAPASRRERVTKLGDRIIQGVGGYVSGAFVVAACAGITSLIFLFVVGLGEYAVALAFVVALLDVIPMIGATIGAVIVSAIALATDVKIGLACVIFYLVYQQIENYVIYPRVMSRSVEIPGAATVIAALVGAALLGVVGALLAIPTAAAILMLTREVFIRRQDAR